ncbi:MAG: glycosyltransferase family 2 protein [Geothrix sp.]|nr:glycosyltransferase family 2 protein [Geothrix sp.]
MISVVILTYNEEVNLPGCLASVAWCDDIVVFDSFSTDRTVEMAQTAGVRVVQQRFENYGTQREAARATVAYRYPWLLFLDADERVDEALKQELLSLPSEPSPHAAYRMRRKDHFMGKWIRHSTLYPSWFTRLLWREKAHYEPRSVHEYPTVEGSTGNLRGHLIHFNFNKGLEDWLAKHNRYSSLEASEDVKSLASKPDSWRHLFTLDPTQRRRALKELSFRLPFRPLLRFLYMYVLRGGFLDGSKGFTYCRLLYFYELMIVLKMQESEQKSRGLSV